MNNINNKIESYKQADKQATVYEYKGVVYKKSKLQDICAALYLNFYLALAVPLIHDWCFDTVFPTVSWWLSFTLIVLLVMFLPLIIFALASNTRA